MSVFAVLTQENNPVLAAVITEKFPTNHYVLTSSQWVISSKETAKQLSDTLGITVEGGMKPGKTGTAVILAVSGYWGRANPDFWEWLKLKLEEVDG